ncbi:membrane protein [Streptomyces sp. SPB074]|uniref:membrane protein n=1 Tax=Streptomyces sp. (strain SPB074) TaxID=465543 RepID=UPI0001D1DC4D|nr:membrane protein [Streptomyces sp. SPB074]EFG65401.1 membrane protein [Streptomyces sp. SPB074]
MGWAVLYFAFAVVALWLLGEVLLQYKARLRWRLLAFAGFLGVVLGVLMASVLVIVLGALAFAAGQTLVTLSFRRGFAAGWALKGKAGEKLGALGDRVRGEREEGPSLEVSDLRDESEAPGSGASAPQTPQAAAPPEAETTAVFDAVNVAEGRGVLSEPAASWQAPAADHTPGYRSGHDPYTTHGYAQEAPPTAWDPEGTTPGQPAYDTGAGTYDTGQQAAYGTGAYGTYDPGAGAYGTGTYDTASFANASPFGGAFAQQPQDPSGTWAGLVQGDTTGTWGITTDGWGQQYAAPQEQYQQPAAGQPYAVPYADPYADPYATSGYGYPDPGPGAQETPPGGVWVPRQRGEDEERRQGGAWPTGPYEGSEEYGYRG